MAMIAFCGLDCEQCPGFHAAERLSMEERQKVAEMWNSDEGANLMAAEIDCTGCAATEGTIGYCAVCSIRQCGLEKGVSTCATCADYGCEKLVGFWPNAAGARENLEALRAN